MVCNKINSKNPNRPFDLVSFFHFFQYVCENLTSKNLGKILIAILRYFAHMFQTWAKRKKTLEVYPDDKLWM